MAKVRISSTCRLPECWDANRLRLQTDIKVKFSLFDFKLIKADVTNKNEEKKDTMTC